MLDADVESLFSRIREEHGKHDLHDNNGWGGYERRELRPLPLEPFSEQSRHPWDGMFTAGVRAHLTASRLAVPLMLPERRGLIVSYGNAGGPVTGVSLGILAQHGSQFVTRPTLFDYYLHPGERAAGAARVFEMIESGAVKITVGQRYGLQDAARAHADLQAGRTTGSTVMIP